MLALHPFYNAISVRFQRSKNQGSLVIYGDGIVRGGIYPLYLKETRSEANFCDLS